MNESNHQLLLNHCPRALSILTAAKKASGQPVNGPDLDLLLIRLLAKAEMYTRMETGDCK